MDKLIRGCWIDVPFLKNRQTQNILLMYLQRTLNLCFNSINQFIQQFDQRQNKIETNSRVKHKQNPTTPPPTVCFCYPPQNQSIIYYNLYVYYYYENIISQKIKDYIDHKKQMKSTIFITSEQENIYKTNETKNNTIFQVFQQRQKSRNQNKRQINKHKSIFNNEKFVVVKNTAKIKQKIIICSITQQKQLKNYKKFLLVKTITTKRTKTKFSLIRFTKYEYFQHEYNTGIIRILKTIKTYFKLCQYILCV
eukprot:TRINITY_DN129_c0_g2_i1.p1 TRINITY_DN129_c0_g2~~TRINITY_DN129_c0_g2_i1.p1  ORF type:complete len:251 (+),score=-6.03 TRINITY_DN129_c0_g2_i1:318-1070(+)